MAFIHDDFLLTSEPARRLYHECAEGEPIFDYHTHLSPRDIAEDRKFANLFEIWLEGDHYKWRAMRADGVPEELVTGDADPREKFLAWAKTAPHTLRNPLYHWTHLELKRCFDIDDLLDEKTGPAIWERAQERLTSPELSARGILSKFQVKALCTTDDPTDDLAHHRALAESGCETAVYPAFRPDKALAVDRPEIFVPWMERLMEAADREIHQLDHFLEALRKRHDYFHELGGRLSDHGLECCHADFCGDREAAGIFEKARSGKAVSPGEHDRFASYMMLFFGLLDYEKGWTKQLHLGAIRNCNTRLFESLGADIGCDSIGDRPQARALSEYLARMDHDNALPKMILYNLNPADNYLMAAMAGNFQDGEIPGKVQFGSGWWFLDQKEGMEWQMNALSNNGLLSRFIGMLTDSRSFMSFPRHEYFRRVLCNLIGGEMARGEIPDDYDLAGGMVRNICYANAREYLGLR